MFLSYLIFSLAMHIACICILYSFSFHKKHNLSALFWLSSSSPHLLQIDEKNKENVLQEVFEQIVVPPANHQIPYDLLSSHHPLELAPDLELVDSISLVKKNPLSFSIEEPSSLAPVCLPKLENEPPLTSPILSMDPFMNKKPEIDPVMQATLTPQPLSQALEKFNDTQQLFLSKEHRKATIYKEDGQFPLISPVIHLPTKHASPIIDPDQMDQIATQLKNPPALFLKIENLEVMRHFLPEISPISCLKNYGFPSFAIANDWNHLFETHVSYIPQDKGYVFSVELFPRRDLSHYRLKQCICFILDRSSSVPRHRFAVFKRAVLKALASMQEEDSFNIFIIDKKVTYFHASELKISKQNIRRAEEFLETQTFGSRASSSDIYKNLETLLLDLSRQENLCNAILLTSGKNTFNSTLQQQTVKKWLENKQGHITLHTAAVGRENDLTFFNLMSTSSGGFLVYSDTHASFPRKLAKLVLDLKDPLLTHLILSARPSDVASFVDLSPSLQSVLYQGTPYTITGYIEDPCTFELSIQGKQYRQWIAIKKNICFADAEKADFSLENQWKMTKAHTNFLKEGKRDLLSDAEKVLKSRFEAAFE
ncbi:MAG: VWA domain-containing protein [Chlamydiales bacterium]|nr:VWA domain-containing protein [Chlamydiales bacterium]